MCSSKHTINARENHATLDKFFKVSKKAGNGKGERRRDMQKAFFATSRTLSFDDSTSSDADTLETPNSHNVPSSVPGYSPSDKPNVRRSLFGGRSNNSVVSALMAEETARVEEESRDRFLQNYSIDISTEQVVSA